MGLFSLDNILVEEGYRTVSNKNTSPYNNSTTVFDIDNIGYIDNDIQAHSFVQEGYDAILEMNAMYCNAEKEFYKRILGSYGDDHIINEGFSNFFDTIKNIIKKFIEWIKKVFKEFVAKLAALVGSEKYIKKHKDLFNKFSSEDEFEYQGYKFTHISDDNIPLSGAVDMFDSDVNSVFSKAGITTSLNLDDYYTRDASNPYYAVNPNDFGFDDFSTWKETDDDSKINARKNATEKMNTRLDTARTEVNDKASDFRDKFRAYVIGKSNEVIDSSDFSNELFEIFRDGEDSTSSITIDYNFVQDAYRRFDKYKEVTKAIEKKKNEMIKDYEDLEKHLDKMIKFNTSDHKLSWDVNVGRQYTKDSLGNINFANNDKVIYDKSTTDKMQSLLKAYSTRVNDMCQIHTQAFSAKLEACKDCFKQDKSILHKAIQKVLKRSNKEGY